MGKLKYYERAAFDLSHTEGNELIKPLFPETLAEYVLDPIARRAGSLAAVVVEQGIAQAAKGNPLGAALGAGFDLVVAAKYYDYVQPENWLWCQHCGLDIYPFLNACPVCTFENRYVHHEGNKPPSGSIGPVTAEALREVLVEYFAQTGKMHLDVRRGREPVDIAIIDGKERTVFVAEIKASPLFTPPLVIKHSPQGFASVATQPLKHIKGTMRGLDNADPALLIPQGKNEYQLWEMGLSGLGKPGWAEAAVAAAIKKNPASFAEYVTAWRNMWTLYLAKDQTHSAYWLTSACGLPRNPGEGWPQKSNGRPTGSISDGKTSVGMDRTDDIKKSTFQVLNLGVKLRQADISPWTLHIGLMSNLHAGHHHTDYLGPYEDIVWGWAEESGEIPDRLFNLFDGIVSFSRSHAKVPWIKDIVDWH